MKKLLLLTAGFYISQILYAQTPVAYYPFSGNANDAIGVLNGTVNGATLTADRFGNANSAYNFDGVDDFIGLNGSFSGYTELTVSAWYKVTISSNDLQAIVSSDNSGKFIHMQVLTSAASNNAVYIDNNSAILLDVPQPVLNQWKQITISAKSGETKLYENGLLISSSNTLFSFISSANLLRIGSGYLNGRFFNGSIDEVKIYNTALNAQQINDLYIKGEICNGFDDDNDGLIDETCTPTVSIANKSLAEGNSDTTDMKFAVTLDHPYDTAVSVRYKTANKTATAGSDYVSINKVLKFNPGQVKKTVTISVLGDVTVEPNEQFNVILINPVNAILGSNDTATGTVRNDDTATLAANLTCADDDHDGFTTCDGDLYDNDPSKYPGATELCNGEDDDCDAQVDEDCVPGIYIQDASLKEGTGGTKQMRFTVMLGVPSSAVVKVKYTTADSTALSSGDYTTKQGTLKFLAGQTQKNISISIVGDAQKEANEYFKVVLSQPVNGGIGDSVGVGLIKNDDIEAPVSTVQKNEVASGNLQIKLSPNPAKDILHVTGLATDKNSISITDLQGRIVLKQNISSSVATVNISKLTPGIYMLSYTDNNIYKTIKFIKE